MPWSTNRQIVRAKSRHSSYVVSVRVEVCSDRDIGEGKAKFVKILARKVAVFRIGGALHGLEADCKHMKASIAGGTIVGNIITCPAHGWQYDITTGACLNEPWARLKTYPVTIQDGVVYVEIGDL